MKSIRRKIESLDPLKNPNWNKENIDSLYYLCTETIRTILPNYDSDILYNKDGNFRGYDFTKDVRNKDIKGKLHLSMTIDDTLIDERSIKFLTIVLFCEGIYKKRKTEVVEYIFSIEKNLTDNILPLQAFASELQEKSENYRNIIIKYLCNRQQTIINDVCPYSSICPCISGMCPHVDVMIPSSGKICQHSNSICPCMSNE